jgi:hypothetical protein
MARFLKHYKRNSQKPHWESELCNSRLDFPQDMQVVGRPRWQEFRHLRTE